MPLGSDPSLCCLAPEQRCQAAGACGSPREHRQRVLPWLWVTWCFTWSHRVTVLLSRALMPDLSGCPWVAPGQAASVCHFHLFLSAEICLSPFFF